MKGEKLGELLLDELLVAQDDCLVTQDDVHLGL